MMFVAEFMPRSVAITILFILGNCRVQDRETHMNTLKIAYSIALISLVAACDGGPGDGTGTLRVNVVINVINSVDNATSPEDFRTVFWADVRHEDGTFIDDASVTLESDQDTIELEHIISPGDDYYDGMHEGVRGSYRLDVTAGAHYVSSAVFEIPDLHVFTAPLPGQSVPGADPLEVTWDRTIEAEETYIQTSQLDMGIPDTGAFTIPRGGLAVDRDQVEYDQLFLYRGTFVPLPGAASFSFVRLNVQNGMDIEVDPDPSL